MTTATTALTDEFIAALKQAGVRVMLDEAKVLTIVPISPVTLWRLCRSGKFPKPSYISANRKIWYLDEIAKWQSEVDGRRRSPRKKPMRQRQIAAAE